MGFIRKFTLYVDGEPVAPPERPIPFRTLFKKKLNLKIGPTVLGMELWWLVTEDSMGNQTWICDRDLVSRISRAVITRIL